MKPEYSDDPAGEIRRVFETLRQKDLQYVVLRGWDGKELSGSDVDILTGSRSYAAISAMLTGSGYARIGRGRMLIDLLAREEYFDRQLAGERIRFHLSDRLLFGKPARLARLPIESQVLADARYDPVAGCFVPGEPFPGLIALYRAAIDRPNRAGELDTAVPDKDIEAIPPAIRASLVETLENLRHFQANAIQATELKWSAINSLSGVPHTELTFRRLQSSISGLFMSAGKRLAKTLKLFRSGKK